jgi:hypothetical protein
MIFFAEFTLSGVIFFDKLRMNGEKGSESQGEVTQNDGGLEIAPVVEQTVNQYTSDACLRFF